jgi:hypothetical protein
MALGWVSARFWTLIGAGSSLSHQSSQLSSTYALINGSTFCGIHNLSKENPAGAG